MTPTIVPVALTGSPQAVYARLGSRGHTALLESSKPMPGLAAWSYVAGPAVAVLASQRGQTTLRTPSGTLLHQWADPFEALREVLACVQQSSSALPCADRPEGLAFMGGLVGYLGYDLARHVERLPQIAANDPPWPEMRLLLCDHVLACAPAVGGAAPQWHVCTLPDVAGAWWMGAGHEQARARVWADTLARAQGPDAERGTFSAGPLVSGTDAARYLAQVRQVQDLISAGDIFQANLSHRIEGAFDGDAFALYQALTAANPAPFAAYLQGGGPAAAQAVGKAPAGGISEPPWAVASVSPERFLKLQGRVITARPIKGTRARGQGADDDGAQRAALAVSPKDRAENLMIVDLMRNDLGRVAEVGSVHVPELFGIEAHPSVWQMVSTVEARLSPAHDAADLLRACWPPGSMTGAPKVRAMEIIETLEPTRRGPYAGAIGYFDAAGDMDLSVVIRTALVHGSRVMVQVGGAVVADSDPQAELDETYAKGQRLLAVLQASAST